MESVDLSTDVSAAQHLIQNKIHFSQHYNTILFWIRCCAALSLKSPKPWKWTQLTLHITLTAIADFLILQILTAIADFLILHILTAITDFLPLQTILTTTADFLTLHIIPTAIADFLILHILTAITDSLPLQTILTTTADS